MHFFAHLSSQSEMTQLSEVKCAGKGFAGLELHSSSALLSEWGKAVSSVCTECES